MIQVTLQDNSTLWDTGRQKGVARMRYLTHPELVGQVCLQCLYYHGTEWDIDDPNAPEAPLHPLCACTVEPVFDAGTEIGQDPNGDPIIANPEPAMDPGQFLHEKLNNMNAEQRRGVLGVSRARLFDTGLIEASQLVSRTKGIKPVTALARSAGVSRQALDDLSNEELRRLSERSLNERRARDRERRRLRRPGGGQGGAS